MKKKLSSLLVKLYKIAIITEKKVVKILKESKLEI